MSISVIVSNFNGEIYLEKLIRSLRTQKEVGLEIIVVDRESQDRSLEILKAYPDIKVVTEPPQSGLVSGYTRGLEVATHDLIFFCNEDIYLDEHCLSRLQKAIGLENRICAADPWQWDYQGQKLLHGETRFIKKKWALHSSYPFREYNFWQELKTNDMVPFACAGAFMIHRKAFEEAGGWDTSFFIDNEDVDLFLRLWQKRWYCVNVPEAKVYHDVGGSAKKIIPKTKTPVSRRRYISDWSSKLVIAFKYFSLPYVFLGWLNTMLRSLNHLRHLRLRCFLWDFLVMCEFVKRKPGVLAYRWRNRKINKTHPGEKFFTDERYQA
ncbi:glycosyltransferase family 2 protein [bacterium]|nr:glycosyltransferase family 2 protein [bacterium]